MKKISIIILSLLVTGFGIAPAMAQDYRYDRNDRNSVIANSNSASVENCVVTTANTGDNTAEGSVAGNGGTAGSINTSGDDVEESLTGTGGNGGNAGVGGTIQTGVALVTTGVANMVNSNTVSGSDDDTDVYNRNTARVASRVMSAADTGKNLAAGSYAGTGGKGGSISSNEGDVEESTTGNGGHAGSSVDGGMVVTGEAITDTSIVNMINRNVTRVRR